MSKVTTLFISPQVDYFNGGGAHLPTSEAALQGLEELKKWTNPERLVIAEELYAADHQRFAAMHLWRKPEQTITTDEGYQQKLVITQLVEGSFGALIHPSLELQEHPQKVVLGTERDGEAFSAFIDAPNGRNTGLEALLVQLDTETLVIGGMKTETLIWQTALAALEKNIKVIVYRPATAAEGEVDWQAWQALGISIVDELELL